MKESKSASEFLKKWDRDLPDGRRCYGVKVCLAAAEPKKLRDGLYRIGVRRILVSYYYLRGWLKKHSVQEIADDFGRFDFVLLDSGGFTLLQEIQEKGSTKVSVKDYADEYYEQLKRFGKVFAACIEVDVYKELTLEYADKKRKEMLAAGVPIIPVVQGLPMEYYEKLGWFSDHHYIALGSKFIESDAYTGYNNELMKKCAQEGVLVHGLAATHATTIAGSKFYSVDSTTWLNGSKFGATHLFENGRIRHIDKDHKYMRKTYRKRFERCGLDWDSIESEKGLEVDLMNGLAWAQMGDYLMYNTQNAYWLTPEEKDAALTLKTKAFNSEGLINRTASIERASVRRLSQLTDSGYDDRAHEVLYCDTCHIEGKCPRFKPGEPCGFDVNVRISNAQDLHQAFQTVMEIQYGRAMTGALFEKAKGGEIDPRVSQELVRFVDLSEKAKRVFEPKSEEEIVVKAKGKKGSLAGMLAGVFSPTGSNGSGSGSTQTQRAAAKVINVDPDVEKN